MLHTVWILLGLSMNENKTSTIMSNKFILQVSLMARPHLFLI